MLLGLITTDIQLQGYFTEDFFLKISHKFDGFTGASGNC